MPLTQVNSERGENREIRDAHQPVGVDRRHQNSGRTVQVDGPVRIHPYPQWPCNGNKSVPVFWPECSLANRPWVGQVPIIRS